MFSTNKSYFYYNPKYVSILFNTYLVLLMELIIDHLIIQIVITLKVNVLTENAMLLRWYYSIYSYNIHNTLPTCWCIYGIWFNRMVSNNDLCIINFDVLFPWSNICSNSIVLLIIFKFFKFFLYFI